MTERPIIIDNGSFSIKAGFAGEVEPQCIFRSIIGREKYRCLGPGCEGRLEEIAGQRASELYASRGEERAKWKWIHPVEWGFFADLYLMELVWREVFCELGADPSQHPVMLLESTYHTGTMREDQAAVMFKKFDVPALYIAAQPDLIMRSTKRHTGLVVDIGKDFVQIVPYYEYYPLVHARLRMDLAGRNVTQHLRCLLLPKIRPQEEVPPEWFRILKEECCYVALDPGTEKAEPCLPSDSKFRLSAPLTNERFGAPECLFNPALVGNESDPLPVVIQNAIEACDIDIRKDLWEHIVLAGGTSMLPNFKERLAQELLRLIPKEFTLHLEAPANRRYAAWIGGSILAQDPEFNHWVSKRQYYEYNETYAPRSDPF